MTDTYIPWHSVQATDRKPVPPLAHVKLVSQGFGYQVHEWVDEAGQHWHIGPGVREYMGMAEEE